MKKLVLVAIVLAVLSANAVLELRGKYSSSKETMLHANLMAAFALDSKYISSCGGKNTFSYSELDSRAPLFDGLGDHTFEITTENKEAQAYFNQGLNLTYGFNHTEAHRSFKQAAKYAENVAMTYWGQAYALSPNINDTNPDQKRLGEAMNAISKAVELADGASELEEALILALQERFAKDADDVISIEGEAYLKAMEKVAKKYDQEPDVLTLYAAAIMNTMPWDYWAKDMSPRANTEKAKAALEKATSINPKHPGAHHYYIHLTELPMPDKAAKSGDALAPLMPGAGHMVHMPSHAYIRVGRYKDAAEANMKAIKADEAYISQCYSQGIYPLGYYPHNIHFLWSAATLMGDSQTAIAAAKKTAEKVSMGQLEENAFMQEFAVVPMQAYVRFGRWDDILTIPYPGDNVKHMKLFWHYARGVAFIRKGIMNEAKEEIDSLEKITKDASYDEIYASINHSGDVADVAYNIVMGEYYAASGKPDLAKRHLMKAVENEDALTYTEPPSWHLSTRQNYGAFLVDQGMYDEAIEIYEADLKTLRNNGWSLKGLQKAQDAMGESEAASETEKRFQKSWQFADIEIEKSVF